MLLKLYFGFPGLQHTTSNRSVYRPSLPVGESHLPQPRRVVSKSWHHHDVIRVVLSDLNITACICHSPALLILRFCMCVCVCVCVCAKIFGHYLVVCPQEHPLCTKRHPLLLHVICRCPSLSCFPDVNKHANTLSFISAAEPFNHTDYNAPRI